MGDTAQTIEIAEALGKPCLVLDLATAPAPEAVRAWAGAHVIKVLNVAGPRESGSPGIYAQAAAFLRLALTSIFDARRAKSG